MLQLLWDASALSKRYSPEVGSGTVNALFAAGSAILHATTHLCYAETCFGLRRKLNRGALQPALFTAARSGIRNEVLLAPSFRLMTVENDDILAGVALIDQHNLNASDAALLVAYRRFSSTQPANAPTCVVVAADQRLLQAAQAEGLRVLNPELVAASDIPALLATL